MQVINYDVALLRTVQLERVDLPATVLHASSKSIETSEDYKQNLLVGRICELIFSLQK